MNLTWKSYGDSGLTAKGDQGQWIIVTDGRWWYLSLHNDAVVGIRCGLFADRKEAQARAQSDETANQMFDRTT